MTSSCDVTWRHTVTSWCHTMMELDLWPWWSNLSKVISRSIPTPIFVLVSQTFSLESAYRLTDTQTDTHTDCTDSITSATDAGGKNCVKEWKTIINALKLKMPVSSSHDTSRPSYHNLIGIDHVKVWDQTKMKGPTYVRGRLIPLQSSTTSQADPLQSPDHLPTEPVLFWDYHIYCGIPGRQGLDQLAARLGLRRLHWTCKVAIKNDFIYKNGFAID